VIRRPYSEISTEALPPRLPIAGYIKVGGKSSRMRWSKNGPWSSPESWTHPPRFEITTRQKLLEEVVHPQDPQKKRWVWDRGYIRDQELHEIIGETPTRLRVRLMFPEIYPSLTTFFGAHDGSRWACQGNGVEAQDVERGTVPCPCPRLKQFQGQYAGPAPQGGLTCKPHGELALVLEDAQRYGVFWVFKTTSYQTLSNLRTQLALFQGQFKRLDALPLVLEVQAVSMTYDDGKRTTQPIVTITMDGSLDVARQLAAGKVEETRKLLSGIVTITPQQFETAMAQERAEEEAEVGAEFHPEASAPGPSAPKPADGKSMEERLRERAAAAASSPVLQATVQEGAPAADAGADYEVVDGEWSPEEEAEAEVQAPEARGSLTGKTRDELNRQYFAMLAEARPGWGDVERKTWQQQKVGKHSCSTWDPDDYELAISLIRKGVLDVELPEGARS
jgi:hypothetical protein